MASLAGRQGSPGHRTERAWAGWIELSLVVALVVADLHGLVPFGKVPFLLALGWASFRIRGLGWSSVGFVRPRRWLAAIALGTAAGLAMELLALLVTEPALAALTGRYPDLSDFRPLVGSPGLLLVALVLNWSLAAFGEELAFRGYLMSRVAGLGGGGRGAWIASLVLVSALFGWGHVDQGLPGMLQEGFAGLLLGLLYLATGRTLAVPIVAHGVSNTVAFVLIFLGRYPGVLPAVPAGAP